MKLRRTMSMLSILTLMLIPVVTSADDHEAVEVTGEVLDLACYVSHEAHGEDHAGCAVKCVKGGQPMGLKAKDGTVYVLFADHGDGSAYEKAKEFAGKVVTISGPLADRGGVKGITVTSVKS